MDGDFPADNTGVLTRVRTVISLFFFFSVLYFKALKDPDSFRTPLNLKFKLSEFKCYELKFPVLDIVTPRHISLSWEPQKPI